MARAAIPGRLNWQLATVVGVIEETARVRSVVLDHPDWPGHRAGQHLDVRLTAEDGYQAQRSYSIASAPEDEHVVLTVERLEDGEVSPYREELACLAAYDEVDVRFTLTREWPEGWRGYRRRIDKDILRESSRLPDERPLVYICGPTAFVEAAASGLVELGYDPARVKTERFGATGGR